MMFYHSSFNYNNIIYIFLWGKSPGGNILDPPNICGCIALASVSTAHLIQDCVLGICTSSAALSLLVQAVVHCSPLSKVIWWSHSPALRQCRHAFFSGWSNNLE